MVGDETWPGVHVLAQISPGLSRVRELLNPRESPAMCPKLQSGLGDNDVPQACSCTCP